MRRKIQPVFVLSALFLLHGCASPLDHIGWTHHQPALETAEVLSERAAKHNEEALMVFPTPEPTKVELTLQDRRAELDAITPATDEEGWGSSIGFNLQLEEATSSPLSMNEAVMFAVQNNLDLEIAALQPAIAAQSIIAAEAAFDFVLGAGSSAQRSRIPQQQLVTSGGTPISSSQSSSDIYKANASLGKKLDGGGTLTLSTDLTKSTREAQGFNYSPDPAWQSIGTVELTQPLLRNFGKKVTLAKIRLSEIVQGQSIEDLKASLNTVITATQQAYLDLGLQWKSLQVKLWLLKQGEQVVDILEKRREYDTSEAEFAQAVATVQQRRVDVITQQATVQTASDTLKKLINTDPYSLDSETAIRPTGTIKAHPLSISLRQALMTAMEKRPDLRNLALSIDSESINVQVADNSRLPQLDLQAQMSFLGLGSSASDGYQEVFNADFVNYLAGLTFQIPLGNRASGAEYQSARLKRMAAVATYKRGIQTATVEVKFALRDIVTNAELMRANRAFRVAQAENLRALSVEEETMSGLTPTFLSLKLQTQNGLANARISEFRSIVDYNKAIASLYEAMGTTLDMHQISIEEYRVTE